MTSRDWVRARAMVSLHKAESSDGFAATKRESHTEMNRAKKR
jgi:hypothetical protein